RRFRCNSRGTRVWNLPEKLRWANGSGTVFAVRTHVRDNVGDEPPDTAQGQILIGRQGWQHKAVSHIDAEPIPAPTSTGVARQPGAEPERDIAVGPVGKRAALTQSAAATSSDTLVLRCTAETRA